MQDIGVITDWGGLIFFYFVCFVVGPLIGRYCGTKIPPEIQSSTGILSLTFHTDMAVAKDGFSASYNMTLKEVNDSKYCLIFALIYQAKNKYLLLWSVLVKAMA